MGEGGLRLIDGHVEHSQSNSLYFIHGFQQWQNEAVLLLVPDDKRSTMTHQITIRWSRLEAEPKHVRRSSTVERPQEQFHGAPYISEGQMCNVA